MVLVSLAIAIAALSFLPEALFWPYRLEAGETTVYSEVPIAAEIRSVLKRSDDLLSDSELYDGPVRRRLFLSQGGWRWNLLALTSRDSFAFGRPFRTAIVFNRSDVRRDIIFNGAAYGGRRTLSATIAHETVHKLIARRYGELKAIRLPSWKTEGYCDFVARESSLSPDEYRDLVRRGVRTGALEYYEARRRVAAFFADGHNANQLFASP